MVTLAAWLYFVCVNYNIVTDLLDWYYKKKKIHPYNETYLEQTIKKKKKKVIRTLSAMMVMYPWLKKEGKVERYIVNVCSGGGTIVMEWVLIRIWLLYYDFTRDIHQLDIRWQRHIISVNYVPWTMKYEFLGNFNILFALSFLVFLVIEGIVMCV
ncbi:hypothetical protein RFI_17406 [Reticulomyxa filosa]|uniref:Uncharacterized protein n=1 Tax=Reticulomyxa filosa TaxID=46433 RepID=X6N0M1_RETFI|nr:hypothetical protein RFI_17406 [Reticulomyxa filosa]|eukprot:ETO19820.1 hypothetical protein RFI_17406 [Reticulomyxa filosa]